MTDRSSFRVKQFQPAHRILRRLVSGIAPGQAPTWRRIGIPGREDEAGQELTAQDVARVVVPPAFTAAVSPLLQPGAVLLQTDLHVLPETTGRALQVLNADVPAL